MKMSFFVFVRKECLENYGWRVMKDLPGGWSLVWPWSGKVWKSQLTKPIRLCCLSNWYVLLTKNSAANADTGISWITIFLSFIKKHRSFQTFLFYFCQRHSGTRKRSVSGSCIHRYVHIFNRARAFCFKACRRRFYYFEFLKIFLFFECFCWLFLTKTEVLCMMWFICGLNSENGCCFLTNSLKNCPGSLLHMFWKMYSNNNGTML